MASLQPYSHLKTEGGHEPAAICYDSKYAANITNRNWDAKTNVEAARINRDLYEAEHERRSGGVIMVHVKGHSGDIGNDYADRFVQDGKGTGPFSRLRLSRSETRRCRCRQHKGERRRPCCRSCIRWLLGRGARGPAVAPAAAGSRGEAPTACCRLHSRWRQL
jgi:hypothetical protein